MQGDPIIVHHDGKEWEVVGDRLVPIRWVEVKCPRTQAEHALMMAETLPVLRAAILKYIEENSPFSKI